MSMNLKEEDRYVVNHGKGLTLVDFGSHKRWCISYRWTANEKLAKIAVAAGFAVDERTAERCRRVEPEGLRRISKRRKGSHTICLAPSTTEGGEAVGQVVVRQALAVAMHDRTRWSREI
ncbi:hypothetical protein B296_00024380 [Ensete ventricosum]|uniref:Uncharacterized protein n=1 Tax=Ensete ventricosum TaxID=4639 RepID=A0A426ZDH8_ENSVE|nr:hypothetical protein B296_00024380 [Ensete ventricosum]